MTSETMPQNIDSLPVQTHHAPSQSISALPSTVCTNAKSHQIIAIANEDPLEIGK
jgi:hypothetical protein